MNKAIYAGTFDPITNGHLDIIERAAKLFGQVVVAVANNPSKQPLIDWQTRVALVAQSIAHLPNVQAVGFGGLLAEFAADQGANVLIRGIRSADDVEYEIQLAQLNHKLNPQLDSIFLPPSVQWRYLSSTMVREIYRHQGDIQAFVPPAVENFLQGNKK